MNRTVLVFAGVSFLIVLLVGFATSQSDVVTTQLFVVDAHPYNVDSEEPGICVTVDAAEIPPVVPLELDVWMPEGLNASFDVADAVVRESDKKDLVAGQQPYRSQDSLKLASARFLFLELPTDSFQIDFYLRAKDKVDPKLGLEYFRTSTLRNQNFRVTPAQRN